MNTTYIYSLCCPISSAPRYIGKSNTPEYRLRKHIEESIRGVKTHKCNWIRSLLKNGDLPKIDIIDTVLDGDWEFWEKHYISLYRSWGIPLTNGTFGGDGASIQTIEVRKKISEKNKGNKIWLGKKHKEESKKKMSERRMGTSMAIDVRKKVAKFKAQKICQYTLDWKFIREWESAEEAKRVTGISHIRCCVKQQRRTAGGYKWRIHKKYQPKTL